MFPPYPVTPSGAYNGSWNNTHSCTNMKNNGANAEAVKFSLSCSKRKKCVEQMISHYGS